MSKDTINRVKMQPTEWEKIFANHVSDKGLTYRIYKELLQLSIKKHTTQLKNEQSHQIVYVNYVQFFCIPAISVKLGRMGKGLKYFSNEDI